MHQIDDPTAVDPIPTFEAPGTPGWFTEGSPGVTPATIVTKDFLNDLLQNLKHISDQVGVSWTKGRAEDLFDSLVALIGNRANRGLLSGRFEYVSPTQARLARDLESLVRIQIDNKVFESASDLTFDITTDLEVGPEAANTWYYCYAENASGVLTPHISATAPEMDPATGKVGYHPTNTGWRFIEAFYNDGSSNIHPFDKDRDGAVWFRTVQGGAFFVDHTTLGTGAVGTYAAITFGAGSMPLSAREILLLVHAAVDDRHFVFAPAALIGTTVSGNEGTRRIGGGQSGSAQVQYRQNLSLRVDPSVRQIAYGTVDIGVPITVALELWVVGWRS